MIVTVDGYDGTGKTTLAKKLATRYNLTYLEKPIIRMFQMQNHCTYEEATRLVEQRVSGMHEHSGNEEKVRFYCEAFIWLKSFERECNIVLDRGILTTYAVYGDCNTEDIFDYYISKGAFFDISFYLVANDEERRRRILQRDPNDPDLKRPIKWHANNLEEFALSRRLNFHKIDTNVTTTAQVYDEAVKILEGYIGEQRDSLSKES